MDTKEQKDECIKVAMRCRPISLTEVAQNSKEIVEIDTERREVIVNNPQGQGVEKRTFTFDIVINQDSSQENVYNKTAFPIVESVLEGFNGTIFAYGQTGTGKTYTMEGNNNNPDNKGIIPRTFEHIYRTIESTPTKQFLVRVSFLEIYLEDIKDLLSKNPEKKLYLRENSDLGVYVKDLSSFTIENPQKMQEKFIKGCEIRKVGETAMNKGSSRSHSIFQIIIEMSEEIDGQQHIKVGKLNLVDLAGSERIQKSQVSGRLIDSLISINQSLSTLGNVISALADKLSYIPYRDSQLTRLLQDSLGGNTKTVIIANIGPSNYNYSETITTLYFANRAKKIKNHPKINQDPKDAMIRDFQDEISRLKDELQKKMGGNIKIGSDGKIQKIVEVEKIVIVQDEQKIRELEEQIERVRQQLNNSAGQKREQILIEMENAKDQKEKLEYQLKEKEFVIQISDQEKYIKQIRQMEKKIIKGDKLKVQQGQKEKDLIKLQIELEERQQIEIRQKEELEKKRAMQLEIFGQYQTLQEEIEFKTKNLNLIIERIRNVRSQTNEIHEYRVHEKEILLEENRDIIKELKLSNLIFEHFIPQSEIDKIQSKLQYSDELDDWIINDELSKDFKVQRPGSIFGFKRPICEPARKSMKYDEANPRFKNDNILQLDLELPQKTTEKVNLKILETINIVMNKEEEEPSEKELMVCINNPELITKENALNQPRTIYKKKIKRQQI